MCRIIRVSLSCLDRNSGTTVVEVSCPPSSRPAAGRIFPPFTCPGLQTVCAPGRSHIQTPLAGKSTRCRCARKTCTVSFSGPSSTGRSCVTSTKVPHWEQAVRAFHDLAARTSPRHVQWRFDPILITDDLGAAYYANRFRQIAAALEGATTRCYFSFAAYYAKAARRLEKAGVHYVDPPLEARQALVETLVAIAADHGITLYACCQADLLNEHVRQAHCVDADLLSELFPDRPLSGTAHPTRA
jgi:hypothetical protein